MNILRQFVNARKEDDIALISAGAGSRFRAKGGKEGKEADFIVY
jgi:hypothetical protein